MSKKNEVAKTENQLQVVESQTSQADVLIAQAIDKGTPIETMEKLLAMRRELKGEWAKEQFDISMSKLQADCPVIEKKKDGAKTKGGVVAYKYAPLDCIVKQTKQTISENGFSYQMKTNNKSGTISATCIVKHKCGHSEASTVEVPLGAQTGVMSAPQVTAAAMTYAKRYAFCDVFGILTGDEDNDAQQQGNQNNAPAKPKPVTPSPAKFDMVLMAEIKKMISEIDPTINSPAKFKTYIEGDLKIKLNPTNLKKISDELLKIIDRTVAPKVEDEIVDGEKSFVEDMEEEVKKIDAKKPKSNAGKLMQKGAQKGGKK